MRTRPALVGPLVAAAGAASILPLYALPRSLATTLAWFLHITALVCAVALLLRGARSRDAAMLRPRRLLAAAVGAVAAGGVLSVVYIALQGAVPVPSLVDPVTLLWVPLAARGFWLIPRRCNARIGMPRLAADAAVAGSALLFASWVAVMHPLVASGRWSTVGLAAQLAYPIVDVAIAAVVLSLLPRVRADLRRMLNLAAGGLLLIAVSDSGFVGQLARDGQAGFGWPNITLQAGMCLLAYGACVHQSPVIRDEQTVPAFDRHLPYVPVLFASGVVLTQVVRTGALDLSGVCFGLVMLIALLVRQALFARDITSMSNEHERAAGRDSLTGLPSRMRFFSHLEEHLATPGTGAACVLILDLDGFKEVNDTFGHEAGDQVLAQFAAVLQDAAHGALTARLGGDEFAVLVVGPEPEARAWQLAEVMSNADLSAAQLRTHVGCSIGIAVTGPGDVPADVLRRADLAMYAAKQSAGRHVASFTRDLAQRAERRHLLTADLAGAAQRGEMHLVYQPLYRLRDGELAGAEALLRWNHPLFGSVAPDEFVPIAEDAGHIEAIGRWVLEQALGQTAAWQDAGRHLPHLFVNVSAGQFKEGFAADVAAVLLRHGITADRLTLEITESQLPGLAVSGTMTDLRAAGVQIALDDFGAGYSSLAQLARLPVDVLKIDREFIQNLGETAGRPVMDAVINLAKALGLSTVAEGIEDLTQAAEASNAGVDYGQGYLFSRPELPEDLQRRLPPLTSLPLPRFADARRADRAAGR